MKRRDFLTVGGKSATAAGLAGMAGVTGAGSARAGPAVRWRLASSYPKSLDTIYGGAERIATRVRAATDGAFDIQVFAADELVPALGVFDAVSAGTVECGHSAAILAADRDPVLCFDTGVPFGLNARQQTAWMLHGGGTGLMRTVFADHNIVAFPAGNTGAQMGGWFRRAINRPEDLRGLTMRISGLGAEVMERLGVTVRSLAGDDLADSLSAGSLDAAEWSGPYDDRRLGLSRAAPYYYYPGWWEGAAQVSLMVNRPAWEALPPAYRVILEQACCETGAWMLAKYDTLNAVALRQLVGAGVVLKPFPTAVMEAAYHTAFALFAERAAADPRFRTVYQAWSRFREEEQMWFRVAENSFDSFLYAQAGQGVGPGTPQAGR